MIVNTSLEATMYADTVRLLQPTVLFTRVCGVCPSALRRSNIPAINKLYGVLLASLGIGFTPFLIVFIFQNLNDITAFTFILGVIMSVVLHVVLIVSSFRGSKALTRFLMIMESAQQTLHGLNIKQPHKPTAKSQILWLIFMSAPVLVALSSIIYRNEFVYFFIILALYLVRVGSVCKMRVLLDLLNEKFGLLNWHLDDLNNRWPLFLPRPPDVSFRELSCVAQYRRTRFLLAHEDTRSLTAGKVREFNKAHLKLHFASKVLNSMFSWDLLVMSVTFALNFIFIVYTLCNPLQPMTWFEKLETTALFVNVITIFLVILTLMTKINEKSQRTAHLVHDLLDEQRPLEVTEQLEQFSLSLVHRKTTFTAAGFFDMDLKLVSRMASVLAPIILFLVQNNNKPRSVPNTP